MDQGTNIKETVRTIIEQGFKTVAAAGGDGTLSAVAGAIVEIASEKNIEIKFGLLPIGTFNHFAKDAGIPLILMDAIEALVKGQDFVCRYS